MELTTKFFFDFQENWTLKLKAEFYFSFSILIWKPNLLKQVSYECGYYLPFHNYNK